MRTYIEKSNQDGGTFFLNNYQIENINDIVPRYKICINKRKRKAKITPSREERKIAEVEGGGVGGGGKRSRWRKDTGIAKEGTDGTMVV